MLLPVLRQAATSASRWAAVTEGWSQTVMTAASEAVSDPEIRAMVLDGFTELDKAFAACFRLAREKRELPGTTDPAVLAQLASATVHTIAIRARAGVPRKELEAIVKGAIDVM